MSRVQRQSVIVQVHRFSDDAVPGYAPSVNEASAAARVMALQDPTSSDVARKKNAQTL